MGKEEELFEIKENRGEKQSKRGDGSGKIDIEKERQLKNREDKFALSALFYHYFLFFKKSGILICVSLCAGLNG